jgi:hypothetical protein
MFYTLRLLGHVLPAWLLLLGVLPHAAGQDLVCRKSAIFGYEDVKNRALRFLGPGITSEVPSMKIYIAVVNNSLYVQSNFETRDPAEVHQRHARLPELSTELDSFYKPTKILTGQSDLDLGTIALNLVFDRAPDRG